MKTVKVKKTKEMRDEEKRIHRETLAMRKEFTSQFYKKNEGAFMLALIATIVLSVFNLIISWLMQQVLDIAAGEQTTFDLLTLALICAGGLVLLAVTMLIDRYATPLFLRKAMQQYKDYAFSEITKKSISSFSGENTSTYISALSNDATSIETNYLSKTFSLIMELIMCFGALAMMLYYSPLLTAVAIGLSLFPIIGSMLTGNKLARDEKLVSDKNEGFIGLVKDLLSGFSVIKSFKAEAEVIRLFCENNKNTEIAKQERRKTETIISLIGAVTGILAQFGVFIFGAYLAISGNGITAGVVIIFVQLMNYILQPISDVPKILANRNAASALIDKLAHAIKANVRRDGKTVDNVLDDAIEIKDLSFGYEENAPIFEHLNYTFEANKSYAIVGGSGSGKSTLLNLLMGSYDNYGGEICFDGDELRSINSDSLYDLISIVQQNVFMFNSSIRDNITMFREFPKDRVDRAIVKSGLASLISERGDGYVCGENGSGLSGGERQRISIARCLLRGTPVMLVDEATSALDAATALSVTESILEMNNLTRIVVTHRLEEQLLKKYDGIMVLKNGKICESGTFKELMDKKEYFYSLFTISQG